MLAVDGDRGLDREADRAGRVVAVVLLELDLGAVELLDRLAAGAGEQVGEVVEVAVEEGAADPRRGFTSTLLRLRIDEKI